MKAANNTKPESCPAIYDAAKVYSNEIFILRSWPISNVTSACKKYQLSMRKKPAN